MLINTNKFGSLEIDAEALIVFPDGIVGFEDQRHWVLLSESNSSSVGWLQSVRDPGLAFCVVTPNAFVRSYALRISRNQLEALPWSREDSSLVLALVSCHDGQLSMNLKAPVVVNLDRQIACQVVSSDDEPLRYPLPVQAAPLRKSA
jgi:flagellar assembly factor FliW